MKKIGRTFTDQEWDLWYPPFVARMPMPMIPDPEQPMQEMVPDPDNEGEFILDPDYVVIMIPELTEEEHVSDVLFKVGKKLKKQGVNVLKLQADSIYD